MNAWLTTRTFGMPRWAFISLLAGGLAVGLYLRHRRQAADSTAPPDLVSGGDSLASSNDPGLAGVGVISPPGGVYPVSSPVVPEGLSDIIGSLAGVVTEQGSSLAALPTAFTPQTPVVNVTLPTGGGPPGTPPKKVPAGTGNTKVNVNPNNPRYGQAFKVEKAKGGVYHVYPGGRKVFVKR